MEHKTAWLHCSKRELLKEDLFREFFCKTILSIRKEKRKITKKIFFLFWFQAPNLVSMSIKMNCPEFSEFRVLIKLKIKKLFKFFQDQDKFYQNVTRKHNTVQKYSLRLYNSFFMPSHSFECLGVLAYIHSVYICVCIVQ